mgnify:CR=1 FL=1
MSWTDERIELLRKLWTDGLSASQIAGELGQVTRNAVIGKVHRLGLAGRAKVSTSSVARPVRKAPVHRVGGGGMGGNIGGSSVARPVMRGNTALKVMAMPQDANDPYDAPYANAGKLHQAGVRFCIRGTGAGNTRNLPYEAAMATAYGLPPEEALKAVTLYPAQILGVAEQLGSIEPAKRANLVITNGDILQPSTQILGLFIDGKPIEPTSKHTRLYDKYRERLKEVREGRAPLGTK